MNRITLGQVGLPSEAVSIILSVDWLLDRLSTFSNSTISNHLDHFNRTLSLSLLWVNNSCLENASFELENTFIISPTNQVPQISIFSLARFRTAINVLGDSIGAGIVNHLSKVIFFSGHPLRHIFHFVWPKEARRFFGRISEVKKKWRGAVSSSNIFRNFTNPLRKASL